MVWLNWCFAGGSIPLQSFRMMFQTTTITKLMIVVTILLAVLVGTVEIGAAQSSPTPTNKTATAKQTPTVTKTPVTDNSTATLVIGPITKITEWSYRNGEFTLHIQAKAPALLTISEAPDLSKESGNGRLRRQSLARGENVVRFSTERSGSTIVLTTPGSIRNGEYAYISPDGGGGSLLSGPPRPADVRDGALGAGLGTAFGALVVIIRRQFGLHRGMERKA